jgi:hypothetical protein
MRKHKGFALTTPRRPGATLALCVVDEPVVERELAEPLNHDDQHRRATATLARCEPRSRRRHHQPGAEDADARRRQGW